MTEQDYKDYVKREVVCVADSRESGLLLWHHLLLRLDPDRIGHPRKEELMKGLKANFIQRGDALDELSGSAIYRREDGVICHIVFNGEAIYLVPVDCPEDFYEYLGDDRLACPAPPLADEGSRRGVGAEDALNLSCYFTALMQAHFGQETIRQINEANEGSRDVCASHDHTDSNRLMYGAFCSLMFREPDPESTADAELMDEAWSLAKSQGFGVAGQSGAQAD